MIISPPFLPARGATQTEQAWLDAAMVAPASRVAGTQAPEGSFPLSHNLSWHNGMHLQAPMAGTVHSPVRAIADGIVRFVRDPTPSNTTVTDAQNYNPFDRPGTQTAAWTDNGCVLIEHTTTIGAAGAAETQIVFYSLYMHLSELGHNIPAGQTAGPKWAVDDRIWRKDVVGKPGQIYGHAGQVHFEIAFNAANLQLLIGRAPAWVAPPSGAAGFAAPTADGRTDSVFGSLYFYLPDTTPTSAVMPTNHIRHATGTTLGSAMWVKMTYSNGSCQFTSYDTSGALIHALPAQADGEYELFDSATDRHNALTAAQQATSSPSGWYELLRFGRNLGRGTASDALPANAAHWRSIAGPNRAAVWADLNAEGVFKFSDADFLAVMGWNFIDDDSNTSDQRCDSQNIKELIRDPNPNNANRMQPEELARMLGNADIQQKLKRLACQFPSEWDGATVAARYGFVQQLEPFVQAPTEWPRLLAHLNAICHTGLPQGYLNSNWHVHPREFIEHMRKCGWLSHSELSQLLPRRHGPSATRLAAITWATARARFSDYVIDLNRSFRKYLVENAVRQTHYLAQTYIETAMWQTMEEFGRAHQQRRANGTLYWPAPAMEFYQPFYGRGNMQLTWAGNYDAYGDFRGFANVAATHTYADRRITHTSLHYWADPRDRTGRVVQAPRQWYPRYEPSDINTSTFNACDSGTHYWVSKNTGRRLLNINRVSDQGVTTAAVARVSVLVNGGGYGFAERQAYAPYIDRFRGDSTAAGANTSFNVAHGGRNHSIYIDFTPQRP
jgi:predicted chitinase